MTDLQIKQLHILKKSLEDQITNMNKVNSGSDSAFSRAIVSAMITSATNSLTIVTILLTTAEL